MLLAVESPRVDLRHGGGDVGAGDVADPGPIRGEDRGHVTRSQPTTAHLVWCRSGHDTPPLLSGRVTSQPMSNKYRGHVAGVDQSQLTSRSRRCVPMPQLPFSGVAHSAQSDHGDTSQSYTATRGGEDYTRAVIEPSRSFTVPGEGP